MKFKGTIIGEASGSLASLTFAHNRGGQYIRQRAVPINSNTTFQQAVRNIITLLASRWVGTLTQAQRDAWDLYANSVKLPDTLGEPRNAGGLAMYCRSNVPRLQSASALTRIDTAPSVFDLGETTVPVLVTTTPPTTLSFTFTNTDPWAGEAGGGLFIYVAGGQNASINYFKGPYRFAKVVLGATTPPTSPVAVVAPIPFATGQKLYWQARACRADGRLTSAIRGFKTV